MNGAVVLSGMAFLFLLLERGTRYVYGCRYGIAVIDMVVDMVPFIIVSSPSSFDPLFS